MDHTRDRNELSDRELLIRLDERMESLTGTVDEHKVEIKAMSSDIAKAKGWAAGIGLGVSLLTRWLWK